MFNNNNQSSENKVKISGKTASKMNCISVQQEKKSYQQQASAYQPQHSNTSASSRAGLRSCLRGEIEDTECKIRLSYFDFSFRSAMADLKWVLIKNAEMKMMNDGVCAF